MMTWTNILKKAVNFGLVGVVAGMVLLNAGTTAAGECTTNTSSIDGTASAATYAQRGNDANSCFSGMPLEVKKDATNIASLPGPRSGRTHAGMDVGTTRGCTTNFPGYDNITAPADGSIWKKVWHCAGGLGQGAGNYIVMKHNLNPNSTNYRERKDCKHYYTVFMHLSYAADGANVGSTYKKGDVFAKVGGTNCKGSTFYQDKCKDSRGKGYAPHMHYEVRMCNWKGPIVNPLCASNQNLCNGAEGVTISASSSFDNSPDAVPLEDCGKFKTENVKKAALAECDKKYPLPNNMIETTNVQENKDCKAKAEADALANMTKNQMDYNACEKRNQAAIQAASNYTNSGWGGSWSGGGGSGVTNDESKIVDFQSNYKCNLAENYNSIQGCMLCEPFKVIFNTASSIARKCHNIFAKSMKTLLGVGLAIWLAWLVMKYVSDMTVKDPGMMLNDIFKQVFIVAFLILLLNLDVARFFEIFVAPVFETGFKFASITMGKMTIGNYGVDGSGLPASMGNSMLSAIEAVENRLEKLMALGSNAMCTALYIKSYHGYPFFPHFGYLITGLILWLTGVVFMVCYPFLLIDSVLQFTIASSLLPVALASTAFKPTYKYLNIFKVIQTFMTAMFVFIFLTIILFILLSGIDKEVKPIIDKTYEASTSFFSLDGIVWYGKVFIKLVFFLFLGRTVLNDIPQFAEQFANAVSLGQGMAKADMGIGRKMGGLYAGAVTGMAVKTAAPALSAGLKGVKATGRAAGMVLKGVGEEVKSSSISNIRSARYSYLLGITRRKMNAAERNGAAAGGFVHGRDWRFRKVSRRIVTNEDGTEYLESSRKALLSGNTTKIKQNDLLALKTKEYKDGSKKETYEVMPSFAQSLFNRDGTKNQIAVNAFMNSQGLTEEEKNKVILNQMLKQRMPNNKEASLENKFKSETVNSYLDKQGRKVFEVRRTDKDGNISVFRRTEGGKRDLIEFEQIKKKNGKAKKISSDGILQKKETYQYNMNPDGSMNMDEETQTIINGAEIKDTQITADGLLLDKDGQVLGKVLDNGNIIDQSGQVIGTSSTNDLAFDQSGAALGKITAQGTIVDRNGNITGIIGINGQILDKSNNVIGRVSSETMAKVFNHAGIQAGSRKVEFSHAKAFKGRKIFDDDGRINYGMRNEELMFDQSDLELYQAQMKKYGDILQHNEFGR